MDGLCHTIWLSLLLAGGCIRYTESFEKRRRSAGGLPHRVDIVSCVCVLWVVHNRSVCFFRCGRCNCIIHVAMPMLLLLVDRSKHHERAFTSQE